MNREDAKVIAMHLEAAIAQLSIALSEAQTRLPGAEWEYLMRVVGLQIGNLSVEALDPIYAEHPDLAPPGVFDA